MKTIVKYALWSLSGIVVTVFALLAYWALTFDANAYKPQIIQAVHDSTHRTLKLDGDIKLMFFPSIGARLGNVSLSEYESDREFASVDEVSVSLEVWPLLQRQVVVNHVSVSGGKVVVVKYMNGNTNIDDLLSAKTQSEQVTALSDRKSSAVTFEVESVSISNCELQFDDQAAGNKVSISKLALKTGRLANDLPTRVEFSAHMQTTHPQTDLNFQLASTLSFNLERNRYSFKGLGLTVEGRALDLSDLMLNLTGDVSVDMDAEHYALNQFVVNASGRNAGDPFAAHVSVPSISRTKEDFSGENLLFNASVDAKFGKANIALKLPSFKGNLEMLSLQGVSLQAGLIQPDQAFSAKLDTVFIGSIKRKQFNLKDLNIKLKANGEKLPGKYIESSLKGSVQADLERQNVHAKFAGGILQSQIRAEAAVNNFSAPVVRYDIEVDMIDLDPYLPPKVAKETARNPEVPEQPFDLSALQGLDATGSIRIGALKAANVRLTKLRVDMKARNGVVNVEPISAVLYQGAINGNVRVNARESSFSITQKLSGVAIAPLMRDAADLELAEGTGNISLDVTTQGDTTSALKQALNGTVSIELKDGAIRGIDFGKLVQGVQNLNKDSKAETLGVSKGERTQFNEFKASLKIKDGVAHNNDLSVRSTVLRVSGNGDVDIGNDKMDYFAKVSMAKTDQGRTGTLPVRVYGPFDAIKFKVDYAELLADIARQRLDEEKAALMLKLDGQKAAAKAKLDAEKTAAKARAEEKLKQGLKNLLK